MVAESEVVEERGRDPRLSGCESHRPPHGSVEGKVTWPGCKPGAFNANWVQVPALPRSAGACDRRADPARAPGRAHAAVDQRQSQWFERPCSGGSNPLGGTSVCPCGESVSFSTWSHTPGHAGAIPASASSSGPSRPRRCRPTGRVCGFKSHVVRVRLPPAARAFVSCFRRRRPTEESVVSEAT